MKRWLPVLLLVVGCGSEEPPGFTDVIVTCEVPEPFKACGGDLQGTWQATSLCSPQLLEQSIDSCSGGRVLIEFGLVGAWTFDDLSRRDFSIRQRSRAIFPQSCLADIAPDRGSFENCQDVDVLEAAPICSSRGDNCLCSGTQLYPPTEEQSTYTVNDSMFVHDTGTEFEYCQRGDVLDIKLEQEVDGQTLTLISRWQR